MRCSLPSFEGLRKLGSLELAGSIESNLVMYCIACQYFFIFFYFSFFHFSFFFFSFFFSFFFFLFFGLVSVCNWHWRNHRPRTTEFNCLLDFSCTGL